MPIVLLGLLHLSYLGVGLPIVQAADRECALRRRLPLAYLSGVLCHVLVLYVAAWSGSIANWLVFGLMVAGLLMLGLSLLRSRPRWSALRDQLALRPGWWAEGGLLLSLIPALALIALLMTSVPLVLWDGIVVWGLKARYLFEGQAISGPFFADPASIHPHPGYPLFLPVFMAEQYWVAGLPEDLYAKQGLWGLTMVGMLLCYVFFSDRIGSRAGLATLGILLYSPIYGDAQQAGSPASGYADFPFSLFALLSLGFFLRYLKQRRGADLLGTVVTLTSTLLLKNEGLIWLISFVVCAAFAWRAVGRRLSWREGAAIGFLAGVFGGLKWSQSALPASSDIAPPSLSDLAALPSMAPPVLGLWFESLLEVGKWGLLPALVVPLFLFGLWKQRRSPLGLMAMTVVLQLGAVLLTLALAGVQNDRFEFFSLWTYPRLILHLLPASLFLALVMNADQQRRVLDAFDDQNSTGYNRD